MAISGVELSANVTASGLQSLTVAANSPGNVTVAWDDFGTGASASPAYDNLMSNLVQPGDAYGFAGSTGVIQSGVNGSSGEEGDWAPALVYSAGSSTSTTAADPTGIATESALNGSSTDVNGDTENDIVVSDAGTDQIGVLLNSTTTKGTFPATNVYSAWF